MWTKLYVYIISVSLVVIGIGALLQRGFYDTGFEHYIDLGPYHQWVGIVLIAVGLFFGYRGCTQGGVHRRCTIKLP
jgi:xanthine/uracil permease